MSKWKNIGSAPKDGTDIIITNGYGKYIEAYYKEGEWFNSWEWGELVDMHCMQFWIKVPADPTKEGT